MANPITGTYAAGDAVSFGDCAVWLDWQDENDFNLIDSWATEITVSGGEIPTTQTYPFSGSAIVFTGVKGPVTVNCTIVYTEATEDAFYQIRTRFESGDNLPMEIRWSPKGTASNNRNFTTSGGKLTACPPPTGAGDANSANVVTFVITADSVAMGQNA